MVRAHASGAIVQLTAVLRGTAGNSIALGYTDNDTNVGATKSGTALSGGTAAAVTYAALRLSICQKIKDYIAAGMVTYGSEEEGITLSNGQEFDFKFHLPNRIPVLLRLTAVISENNLLAIPDDEDIRQAIFDNVEDRYKLGYNFEPQRYYPASDALWAGSMVLEWSRDDGDNWNDDVFEADFDELFIFDLEDISVVIS